MKALDTKVPMRSALLVALVTALAPWSWSQRITEDEVDDQLPRATPAAQAAIRRTIHAEGEEAHRVALLDLRALSARDPLAFVPELFHYTRSARTTRDAMAFGVLIRPLDLSPATVVRAMVPFLEAKDAALYADATGILTEFEDPDPLRPPSFSYYRPLVAESMRAGGAPPLGLTSHLFDTHAGSALLLLMRVSESEHSDRQPVLWAEHVLEDLIWRARNGFSIAAVEEEAERQLVFLAHDTRWWARFAAAAYLARHEELARIGGRVGLNALLEVDAHELVRAYATRE